MPEKQMCLQHEDRKRSIQLKCYWKNRGRENWICNGKVGSKKLPEVNDVYNEVRSLEVEA